MLKKCLAVGVICLLILTSLPTISGGDDPDYNLTIKIQPIGDLLQRYKLFWWRYSNVTFKTEVFNEGPDVCDSYKVEIDIIRISLRKGGVEVEMEYDGYSLEPENSTVEYKQWKYAPSGFYIAKATVYSEYDNDHIDDESQCIFYVLRLHQSF